MRLPVTLALAIATFFSVSVIFNFSVERTASGRTGGRRRHDVQDTVDLARSTVSPATVTLTVRTPATAFREPAVSDDDRSFKYLLGKCREARDAIGFPGQLSTEERLAAALVLNRHDWLAEEQYTLVEAIDRIGPDWASLLSRAVAQLKEDHRARLAADEPTLREEQRSKRCLDAKPGLADARRAGCRAGTRRRVSPRSLAVRILPFSSVARR